MNRIFRLVVLALAAVAASCADNQAAKDVQASSSPLGAATLHYGCCDASAGVAVSSNLFLVANDEDNLLRVYRRDQSGPAVQGFATGEFLHVVPKQPECEIEGAARMGDRIYWITSHERNRQGEARARLLAQTVSASKTRPANGSAASGSGWIERKAGAPSQGFASTR